MSAGWIRQRRTPENLPVKLLDASKPARHRRVRKLWEWCKMENMNRHDPFGEDEFLGEVAAFEKKKPGRKKNRLSEEDLKKIAQRSGFDNRTTIPKPIREPLKPLQFRLQESEVNAFRQRAYEEFGPGQGAIIALFRKIWKKYCDSNV